MESNNLSIEEIEAENPVQDAPAPEPAQPEQKGRFRAIRSFWGRVPLRRILFILVGLALFSGVALGAFEAYQNISAERSILSLLPRDTEYFARVTIDKDHPQVKMADELVRRFPGVDKIKEKIEPFFIEILRQPLDPFEPIFSLADKEIFLAKISERPEGTRLDQLVNIIEVEDEAAVARAGQGLKDDERLSLDSYSHEGKTINHAVLAELKNLQFEQYLGPIPYQMTIPFSKETYFTNFENFLVSADKKSDVETIVSLVNSQAGGLLKDLTRGSILEDASYANLKDRLPKNYLLQFYQKQKAIPNVTQFPGEFGTGFISADSFNRYTASIVDGLLGGKEEEEENIHDIKIGRAMSLAAQTEGIDFSVVQEQLPLSLSDLWSARKLVFAFDNSLAYKVPKKLDDAKVDIWFEIHNIAGQIEFAENLLAELIVKAPDEETRRVYVEQRKLIGEIFDAVLEELFRNEVSRDELFEILGGRFAFYAAPRFGGEAPIWGFMLQTEDTARAEEIFGKIVYETSSYVDPADYRRQSDLQQISLGLTLYYEAHSRYPKTLDDLEPDILFRVPEDPETGDSYRYSTFNDRQSYIVEATLSSGTKISATESLSPVVPPAQQITIRPLAEETYKDATIYRLDLTRGRADSDLALAWIVGQDALLFSRDVETVKELYDFYMEGDKDLSLGRSQSFTFQKARTPSDVMMLGYLKPEGLWGLAEYWYAQSGFFEGSRQSLSEAAGEELTYVIQSYLRTLEHLFLSVSGDQNVLESSLFFRIEEIPEGEKKQAETYIEDLLEGRAGPGRSATSPVEERKTSPVEERNAQRIGNVRSLQLALESYYDENLRYPRFPGGVKLASPLEGDAAAFEQELVPDHISPLPMDSLVDQGFYYEYTSFEEGQDYLLTARLEEPFDEEECDRTITTRVCIFAVRP